jgi:hypothetical protein
MRIILFFILLFSSSLTFADSFNCKEVNERSIKINNNVEVSIVKIGKVCAFSITTSKASRISKYDGKKLTAQREWSFQSSGKINVLSNYEGPTDSSSTSYKSYQLFPNKKDLILNKGTDGAFSLNLPNGAKLFFKDDGSIDNEKTVDLKIKDTPINVPKFKKSMSLSSYRKIDHLPYKDPKKVAIRVHHRNTYSSLTSKSIGLETNIGMYIPLGIAMGKIPGNEPNKTFTLFGKDDEKLCKKKMPAHHFFNYKVKCSSKRPNSQCPCKKSQDEIFNLININSSLESEIRTLKFKIKTLRGDEKEKAMLELEIYEKKYDKDLYSKLFFSCHLEKSDALKFVSDKRHSGDHREIDGLNVKEIGSIYNSLISSGKCNRLKMAHEDCVSCGLENLLDVKSIENQKEVIESITDKIQ